MTDFYEDADVLSAFESGEKGVTAPPEETAMSEPNEPDASAEQMDEVDQHPDAHRPTEVDEESVLSELYGEPGADGVYRGDGT